MGTGQITANFRFQNFGNQEIVHKSNKLLGRKGGTKRWHKSRPTKDKENCESRSLHLEP